VLVTMKPIRDAQQRLWSTLRFCRRARRRGRTRGADIGRYVPQPKERVAVLICGGNTVAVDFDR